MKRKSQSKNSNYSLAHVLYQKLGNDWYAFTEVDGDCFMTKVDPDDAAANAQATREDSGEEQQSTRPRRKAA